MSLPAGTRLDPYGLSASLGAGGMGEVYRARDARLSRDGDPSWSPDGKKIDLSVTLKSGDIDLLEGF